MSDDNEAERLPEGWSIPPETPGMDWADDTIATQAEEPIEDRLRRAWLNGFVEGVQRSGRGIRWDHS